MKNLALASVLLILAGCATPSPTTDVAGKGAPLRFEETFQGGEGLKSASGNRYFLSRDPSLEAVSGGFLPALIELENALKKRLKAAGYLPTKNEDSAHLRIVLSGRKDTFGPEGYRFRQRDNLAGSAGPIEISGSTIITVGFFVLEHKHGMRPKVLTSASSRGALESFNDPKLYRDSFARILNKFFLPKASSSSARSLPGCFPSFGFQTEEAKGEANSAELATSDEDQFQNFFRQSASPLIYKVSKIVANGPAAKAGLKVGDIVEAIDSVPYETIQRDGLGKYDSMYDSRAGVPIKFRRGEEVRRSTLASKILCYSDLK
ncbi:MAG: hypothetical protein EOP11_10300 [Proteobacteria bacterium]|nr:MAG: hypothetical protein EOP11_10300 [Pseudomonadota bacterium]